MNWGVNKATISTCSAIPNTCNHQWISNLEIQREPERNRESSNRYASKFARRWNRTSGHECRSPLWEQSCNTPLPSNYESLSFFGSLCLVCFVSGAQAVDVSRIRKRPGVSERQDDCRKKLEYSRACPVILPAELQWTDVLWKAIATRK